MGKGIEVTEILKALPRGARAEFADKLKREGGVEVAFTIAGKRRKRKHRWGSAGGKVYSVRFTDVQNELVVRRAAGLGLSPGEYLKWLATRSHTK
jgi:hypothetical protein